MRTFTIVKVEWEDSTNWRGWRSREKRSDIKPSPCVSAGILVQRNKDVIAVSHSYGEDDFGDTIAIPRKCTKSIEVIARFKK